MITSAKINLAKELRMRQAVKQIIDAGQWVCIPHRSLVQHSIIYAHPHAAILLADKDDWCAPAGRARTHPTFRQIRIQLRAHFIQLCLRHSVLPWLGRCQAFIMQLNVVLNVAIGMLGGFSKHIRELSTQFVPPFFALVLLIIAARFPPRRRRLRANKAKKRASIGVPPHGVPQLLDGHKFYAWLANARCANCQVAVSKRHASGCKINMRVVLGQECHAKNNVMLQLTQDIALGCESAASQRGRFPTSPRTKLKRQLHCQVRFHNFPSSQTNTDRFSRRDSERKALNNG